MDKPVKIVIIIALIVLVGIVIALKQQSKNKIAEPVAADNALLPMTVESTPPHSESPKPAEAAASLPRLVDLGAGKCIPCKMMAPILEDLKKEYQGKLDVVFIDVWEKPDEAKKYDIKLIPTQIFYDASGKELFRHEGFVAKEDILNKWKELGIVLETVVK